MKKTTYLLLMILIASALILGACNMPEKESQEDIDATTVAETAAAVFTKAAETAAAVAPSATSAVPATFTPVPTNTLYPTQAATATATPIPCNRASFSKDVTYPDNTAVAPGEVFTKTWEIKNTGSCTWTSGYVLLFNSGDQMNAPATAPITSSSIAPGSTVSISVQLTAPTAPGTYQGNFKLRSPDNIVFGINADGQGPFWVKVVVPSPTATATTVPAPDFSMSYENVHNCGTPYATVKVTNTGGLSFESVEILIEDTNTSPSTILYGPGTNNTPFLGNANGCPPDGSTLATGATAYIAANIGSATSGHDAKYTLKMCTADSVAGNCITRSVTFVIP